jgi:hypothetical protein
VGEAQEVPGLVREDGLQIVRGSWVVSWCSLELISV